MTVTVAAFCGSLRAGSYNAALLRTVLDRAPDGLRVVVFDICDLPLFDQDREADPPAAVTEAKRVVQSCDGLLIVTPEYNYGIPGTTKNAIDWLSRPFGDPTLRGRPVAFMGASTGRMGTIRGQMALRQLWHFFRAPVFSERELALASAREQFDEEGRLVSETYAGLIDDYLVALRDWLLRGPTL